MTRRCALRRAAAFLRLAATVAVLIPCNFLPRSSLSLPGFRGLHLPRWRPLFIRGAERASPVTPPWIRHGLDVLSPHLI